MKKLTMLVLVLLLALANGAMAEGMDLADTEIVSGTVDSLVPEEEVALPGGEEAAVGDTAVSPAAGDVAIDAANFPDEGFLAYVRDWIDPNHDGILSQSEIASLTEIEIEDDEDPIRSLEGIKRFTSLTDLVYWGNATSFDFSGMTSLRTLECNTDSKATLDVSGCTSLNWLDCSSSQIVQLNASGCTRLEEFYFKDAPLEKLNLSGCVALTELDLEAYRMPLTDLNLSGCTALTKLEYYQNDYHIGEDQTLRIDVSGCTALSYLGVWGNRIDSLNIKGCKALTQLSCRDNLLPNLDVSGCTALTELNCGNNRLTKLDVSRNAALKELDCSGNQLKSLDVGNCKALAELDCFDNQLTSINVSKNAALEQLSCSGNSLTSLDLRYNTGLLYLECGDNPITDLDVSKNVNLVYFYCGNTRIANLDVSKNKKLVSLICFDNKLTSLDTTKNTALGRLDCIGNQLTSLELSKNTELYYLGAADNNLTCIDISNCPVLCNIVQNGQIYYDYAPNVIDFEYDVYQVIINPDMSLIANGKALYGKLPEPEPTVAPKESIKKATVTVKAQSYTGKALKPAVTVKLGKKTLKKGTDYTVGYADNVKVGKATVTVKGKGNYTGTVKATFKIDPQKVSGLKLKAGTKKLTVTWKKAKGAAGYQLQYATKKDFSNAKKTTVKKAATVKATLKKLEAKQTYYVRIRAYKKVKGTTYYSAWVSAKGKTK